MQTGEALKTYWMNSVNAPVTSSTTTLFSGWFRIIIQSFLDQKAYLWFGKMVAIGEFMVGLALILGFLVGIAAFFGGVLNLSYFLAGSVSYGPVLLILELVLLVAWKTAGYYGLDRYFFKFIGAPWKPEKWFQKKLA